MWNDINAKTHAMEIIDIVRKSDNILVAAHGSPDGDAMGCTAGMGWILQSMGKHFALYNVTGIPDYLSWMNFPSRVCVHLHEVPFKPQLLIILDCGDSWRVGTELSSVMSDIPSMNIDHHISNPSFGTLHNWVDASMAATGQMLEPIADAAQVPLQGGLAEAIYVSLVSDTGSFSHGNTTSDVFLLAARLLKEGLDAAKVRSQLDNQWSMSKARLWGMLLSRIRLENNGKVAVCIVTLEDLANADASKEDAEGFVEQMLKLRGVRVSVLIREDKQGLTKLSMRSCGDDDVRIIAEGFGGGGHKNAAGANIQMSPDKVAQAILNVLRFDS